MENSERIFADTNYFVALFYPYDTLHQEARRLAEYIQNKGLPLTTSNLIFLETVTVLSQKAGKAVSREAGIYLRTHPFLQSVHIDETLHEDAWNIFQHLPEKNISFVDCATIAVMRAEHINHLLTFDVTDFRKLKREYNFTFFKPHP